MATFAGPTSPAALAALAPSITNLAAAQRAKSQAAAGLMNTLGVQFEKQKEQEAKRQKNEAALEIAKGLIADPAFRRQMPGVTDAAGLVKVAGAENVLDFGIKTQQADRLAQQSAAQIALTQKQIEQYDIEAKQREADEASSKAFTNLVGSMYGEGTFSQEDLMAGLKGLNSKDAASALRIYNERNPQDPLREITVGGKTYIYSSKTGNAMLADDGSKLSKEVQSQIASVEQMDLPPERKQEMIQRILEYAATPRDREGYPIEGFGGQPAAAAAGPFVPTEAETVLFSRLPDNIFTEDNMVDSEKLEAELAKMDFLSPEEVERMRRFAASQSVNRKREAYLKATEEQPAEQPRFLDRLVTNSKLPTIPFGGIRYPTDTSQRPLGGGGIPRGPGIPMVRPSARVPAVVTGQPGPGIGGGMEATGRGRLAASQVPSQEVDFSQGPLSSSASRTIGPIVEDIKRRIEAIEEKGLSFSFNRAKELAQERVRREQGRNQKTVLKELKDIDLKKIGKKPKNASEAKAQKTMLEVLMEMLDMGEAPVTSYGDPRMQSQPLLPVE